MRIRCPNCEKNIGGIASEGGLRIRLAIVLFDPDTGRVHGPCPRCKLDVTIAGSSDLNRLLFDKPSVGCDNCLTN